MRATASGKALRLGAAERFSAVAEVAEKIVEEKPLKPKDHSALKKIFTRDPERLSAHLEALEQAADVDLFDLAERAEESKRVVRSPQFYEAEKLETALNTFREVMAYISTAYYPASLVFYPMESNLGYRPGVSKEVFACLDD